MAGESPAVKAGHPALLAHNTSDYTHVLRLFGDDTGQLEVSRGLGKITLGRNSAGRMISIAKEYVRPDGTITRTRTITRDANNRITELSEAT